MRIIVLIFAILAMLTVLTTSQPTLAQDNNALAQCRAQSLELERIHACMDNYLDLLDANMGAITDFLGRSLRGEALTGLNRSQQSFVEYRRQNCLWYLEFSSPRIEAEQIAKNCLAGMSRERLQELQDLVTADSQAAQTLEGFYVFGVDRNSFQPCTSTDRYWVEGESGAVGLLQQSYMSVSTDERQLLHAVLVGTLDGQTQAPDGHEGVLQLDNLIELRVPTDTDCTLPNSPFNLDISVADIDSPGITREVADEERVQQEEPEQQLTAYFGSWIVDCIEMSGSKSCALEVGLLEQAADADAAQRAKLVLNRAAKQSTFAMLEFAGQEIDSPSLIRWQIDSESLGDIVGSKIRVDQLGTRLLVGESEFLIDVLMPLMIGGETISISVLETVDARNGETYDGTLLGLTKALAFADGFVRESS